MDQETHVLIQRLSNGLEERQHPDACPACIFKLRAILLENPETFAAVLRRYHGAFLSKLFAFVALERSDRATLTDQLYASLARCPHASDDEHTTFATAYALDPTSELHCHAVISALCLVISVCLDFTPRALWRRMFRRRTWPAGANDLVQNGEADCQLQGLLFWFIQMDDPHVFGTFVMVFLLCRSAFYPIITAAPLRSNFIRMICVYCLGYARILRNPHSDECHAVVQMRWIVMLLTFIRDVGDDEWPEWRSLFRGFEPLLLSCLAACEGAQVDDAMKLQLRDFAIEMHRSLGVECLCCIPRRLAEHAFERHMAIGGPFGHLLWLIQSLAARRACGGPNCPGSREDAPVRLLMCASCTTLRYCSRQCQREHWRMAGHPHKRACQQLRGIKSVTRPGMAAQQFEAACASIGFGLRQLVSLCANLTQASRGVAEEEIQKLQITSIEALLAHAARVHGVGGRNNV